MKIEIQTTKTVKVFYPSLGKVVNKRVHILKSNELTQLAVLVEDMSKYGKEATQAHTALINDGNDVFHFSGGLYNALNKFDSLDINNLFYHQKNLRHLVERFEI